MKRIGRLLVSVRKMKSLNVKTDSTQIVKVDVLYVNCMYIYIYIYIYIYTYTYIHTHTYVCVYYLGIMLHSSKYGKLSDTTTKFQTAHNLVCNIQMSHDAIGTLV
jgi:hypothetical protein